MKDGYVRCGCAVPEIKTADCEHNASQIIAAVKEAAANHCSLLTLPELCITGSTCGDLFFSKTLIDGASKALTRILSETANLDIAFICGIPLSYLGRLYNCAAVCCKGKVLGFVPKKNCSALSDNTEARYFADFREGFSDLINDFDAYMGNTLFCCTSTPDFTFGAEIGNDLTSLHSPSEELAAEGAVIICNPSATAEVIGSSAYRHNAVQAQSGRLACAYIRTESGNGESTQDMVFSGHSLIYENGTLLAEKKPFSKGIIYSDIDTELILSERRKASFPAPDGHLPHIYFDMNIPEPDLCRRIDPMPFVPSDKSALNERCEEILAIQSSALASRLNHIGARSAVLGLSGGLDSTLALIVTVHAFDMLGLDKKGITAVTMPCFGTTKRTKSNALILAEAYGTSIREINISASVRQHFADIGHSEDVHDVTYENSQARERTQVIMDIANMTGGIVIGTGDLSELALGWATYNGDHMSMYGVNASVPKTLIRHVVAYEAERAGGKLSEVLRDILDTPVSPELLPPSEDGTISQKTEDIVGPYELHDFFLFYTVRYGFSPKKIFRLAKSAFDGAYADETILKWLRIFTRRFFTQQFKRSCLPDGPKVGTVTLSPRGGWLMPSDASAALWLAEFDEI